MERISKVAFEAAMKRGKRLCSVEKSNVLEVGVCCCDGGGNAFAAAAAAVMVALLLMGLLLLLLL